VFFVLTKKKDIFLTNLDIKFNKPQPQRDDMKIIEAMDIIFRQMKISGIRERTIYDYRLTIEYFIKATEIEYLADIDGDSIYRWLSKWNVKDITKLSKLKCLKAFLSRCHDNGWIQYKFWSHINIKVDTKIKEGTSEDEVYQALSHLDFTKYLDLRNGTAILLIYKTGIRVSTLVNLEESHIDFENQCLNIGGDIMKNHNAQLLPFDETLNLLLKTLIQKNNEIREAYGQNNNYLFISSRGKNIQTTTSNSISKALHDLSKTYALRNITPHALRRGFAKNLYNKSNDLLLVSKALGHSDLSVTTRYLHTKITDVSERLREYL